MAWATAGRAEALRRRVEGWRAAERRERTLRASAGVLSPREALLAAFELYALCPSVASAGDSVRRREVEEARALWRRLRARLGCHPTTRAIAL